MNTRTRARTALPAALLACWVSMAGCSKPQPPETDPPPKPQAAPAAQATELRDAIQQPLDRAEAAKRAAEDAAKAQRATIDEATGR